MPSSEIMYWSSYIEGTPTDSQRLDYLISLMAMSITDFRNANRPKGVRASSVNDLLPDYMKSKESKQSKSIKQQEQEALAWALMYKSKTGMR